MIVEVVNTGTELLLGEILNTNFQYLSRQLNKLGYDVLYRRLLAIRDQAEKRFRNALERAWISLLLQMVLALQEAIH